MTTPSFQQSMRRLQGSKRQIAAIKEARIQSMVEGLKYYGNVLIADHFTSGNQFRMGWPPLTPEYAARKARRFGGRPMLVATGDLRNSVVGKFDVKTDRRRNNPVRLVFNQMVDYGEYVNEVREFLSPSPEDWVKIQAKTEADFRSKLNIILNKRI